MAGANPLTQEIKKITIRSSDSMDENERRHV